MQEYLLETSNDLFPDAEVDITRSCLDYLSLQPDAVSESSVQSHLSSSNIPTRFERWVPASSQGNKQGYSNFVAAKKHYQHHSLLNYATLYWGVHARHNAEEQLKDMILQYLEMEREEETLQFHNGNEALRWMFIYRSPYCVKGKSRMLSCCNESEHSTHYLHSLGSLHRAAAWGFTHLAKEHINQGGDVSDRDDHGWTALFWAVRHGHEGVLNLLIEKKADPDPISYTSRDTSPLFWAARYGHETAVNILLKNGADFKRDILSQHGTAMGAAVGGGHTVVVKRLLDAGVRVNDHGISRNNSSRMLFLLFNIRGGVFKVQAFRRRI